MDFQRSKERFSVLAEQLASNRRITRLSDDPTGAALIMDFQNSIERNNMYVKQGESASTFLKGTESALNAVNTQLDRLLELAEAGMSDLNEGRGRQAMAAEIDILRTIILDLSNTQEQGKYLFAGTNTKIMPFEIEDNGVPNIPPGPTVYNNGNLGTIDLDISPSATVTTNLTGELVFQGTRDGGGNLDPDQDLFVAVTQLRDGMLTDDPVLIKQAYDNIRAIKDRINVCLTTVGSRQVSIDNTAFNLGDFNESLRSIQSTYGGVDYPSAITRFNAEQASQDAALSILSKMGRMNLFDYLG
jgi:flagellar hook-associated protein 3 FlgL